MSDTLDTQNTRDTLVGAGGNTDSASSPATSSKKFRNWFFTWNNFNDDDWKNLKCWLESEKTKRYACQPEIGKSGTPHIQGVIAFINARSLKQLHDRWPKIHWEVCKSLKDAVEYCTKVETRAGEGIEKKDETIVVDPLLNKTMRDWQNNLLTILEKKPDDRKIIWIHDEFGNSGKTSLAKHLCIKHPDETLYLSGGPSNCKYGIMSFLYTKSKGKWVRNERVLKTVIFDFTRSVEERVSYQALEEIKNGIFFNTKYETMMVMYNCPHVVVFANFSPDESKLSSDRWLIVNIEEDPEY